MPLHRGDAARVVDYDLVQRTAGRDAGASGFLVRFLTDGDSLEAEGHSGQGEQGNEHRRSAHVTSSLVPDISLQACCHYSTGVVRGNQVHAPASGRGAGIVAVTGQRMSGTSAVAEGTPGVERWMR